jgi:FixJ family two-component response regulator
MPGSGEVSLYDELAATQPSLRVLYMSGYADETMVQRGWLSAGMPYLPKPFTAHELIQKCAIVLGTRPSAARTFGGCGHAAERAGVCAS